MRERIKAKTINRLVIGVTSFGVGLALLIGRMLVFETAMILVAALVLISSFGKMLVALFAKPRQWRRFFEAAASMALGAAMLFFPLLPQVIVPELFAGYLLLNRCVKLVDCVLIIRTKSEKLLLSVIPCIAYFVFGGILAFSPLYYLKAVLIIIGIYGVLFGITYIFDFVRSIVPEPAKNKAKRYLRISLPIFLAAFLPHTVLTKLNRYLMIQQNSVDDFEDVTQKKIDGDPDIEIFIHVASDGFCMIGHSDVAIDGELIAYGNYDESSSSPIATGDGVLIIAQKESYIPFCLEHNKTTIFSFGIRLNKEQKEAVRERVREIKSQLVAWDPPKQAAQKAGDLQKANECNDFSSCLVEKTGAKLYKFTKGRFKKYFVLSTNCVLLVDSIICKAGTDILSLSGIISPGTLYEYLESQFLRKDSMVVTRHVYQREASQNDKLDAEK